MPMLTFFKNKKKDIFFTVFFLITFVLSTKVMPQLAMQGARQLGITVKADLLLAAVISLGLLQGKKYAAVYALAAGFIFDVFVGNPYAFSPVVYFLCGYFAEKAAAPFSRKTPLSVLLIAAMLLWIKALASFFYLMAISRDVSPAVLLTNGVVPEYLVNVISTALIFAVMRILMALFRIPVQD